MKNIFCLLKILNIILKDKIKVLQGVEQLDFYINLKNIRTGLKMFFVSPTKGRLTLSEVVKDIVVFMEEEPSAPYKLIIGTDSHTRDNVCFVTAIIVHRVGTGGRYYYRRKYMSYVKSLRHKIFTETSLSLETVTRLKDNWHIQGIKTWMLKSM